MVLLGHNLKCRSWFSPQMHSLSEISSGGLGGGIHEMSTSVWLTHQRLLAKPHCWVSQLLNRCHWFLRLPGPQSDLLESSIQSPSLGSFLLLVILFHKTETLHQPGTATRTCSAQHSDCAPCAPHSCMLWENCWRKKPGKWWGSSHVSAFLQSYSPALPAVQGPQTVASYICLGL